MQSIFSTKDWHRDVDFANYYVFHNGFSADDIARIKNLRLDSATPGTI